SKSKSSRGAGSGLSAALRLRAIRNALALHQDSRRRIEEPHFLRELLICLVEPLDGLRVVDDDEALAAAFAEQVCTDGCFFLHVEGMAACARRPSHANPADANRVAVAQALAMMGSCSV